MGELGGLRSPSVAALVQGNRALSALLKGRLEAAAAAFGEQMDLARAHALSTFYFEAFLGFAALAAACGEDRRAAMLAAASAHYDDRGVWASEQPVYDKVEARFLEPARRRLGAAGWRRAGAEARAMTTGAVLALADETRSGYLGHPLT